MEEPVPDPPQIDDQWILEIISDLSPTFPTSSSWNICKVPIKLRSVNEDAYTPHIVSIGPIHHQDKKSFMPTEEDLLPVEDHHVQDHEDKRLLPMEDHHIHNHGDTKLLPMEDHKRRYLKSLFMRTQNTIPILKNCCDTILGLDEQVRASYVEPILYDKEKLAKILLYDAGFMLELFIRYSERGWEVENDPIFNTSWMILTLQRDLALLENQIPLFVLKSVFERIAPPGATGVKELALRFFKSSMNIKEETFLAKCRLKGNHLLHLLYNCYVPLNPIDSRSNKEWEFINSATSLSQAGVVFEKNMTDDLFDLQFDKGTFKIPPLIVHASTDSLFRNLVAFEQCQQDNKYYITSYIVLMDRLIDKTNDVDLLQLKGIIVNDLSTEDDVSDIFNNICKGTVLRQSQFYFPELCDRVNGYAKTRWHRYKAAARRDYFKSPWSITSFAAASAVVLFTFLQTLYSLLAYYYKS